MAGNQTDWTYCVIRFLMRNKGEDITRSGIKHMWLVFQARTADSNERQIIMESTEIPVPVNLVGVQITPRKDNPTHVSIHQELVQRLQSNGWQQLPGSGGAWWERRFRRWQNH
jgi:hypothetical protein